MKQLLDRHTETGDSMPRMQECSSTDALSFNNTNSSYSFFQIEWHIMHEWHIMQLGILM